jgi:hypothetical protein
MSALCTCRPGARKRCGTCLAIRKRLRRDHPGCVHCRKPCVGGQVDALGRPAHLICQLALYRHPRFRDKAHLHPGLPRYPETSPGTVPGGKENTA